MAERLQEGCTAAIAEAFITLPVLRIIFPGLLLVLTVASYAAPRFHTKAVQVLRNHLAQDALFNGNHYFVITLLLYRRYKRLGFSAPDHFALASRITGMTVFQSLRHCMNLSFFKSKYST